MVNWTKEEIESIDKIKSSLKPNVLLQMLFLFLNTYSATSVLAYGLQIFCG